MGKDTSHSSKETSTKRKPQFWTPLPQEQQLPDLKTNFDKAQNKHWTSHNNGILQHSRHTMEQVTETEAKQRRSITKRIYKANGYGRYPQNISPPIQKEDTVFLSCHGTFYKINYITRYNKIQDTDKTSLNRYKKIAWITDILTYNQGLRLVFKNKNNRKPRFSWKQKKMYHLLNDKLVREEIKKEMKDIQ